jgi:hypothetical protein
MKLKIEAPKYGNTTAILESQKFWNYIRIFGKEQVYEAYSHIIKDKDVFMILVQNYVPLRNRFGLQKTESYWINEDEITYKPATINDLSKKELQMFRDGKTDHTWRNKYKQLLRIKK